MRGGEPYLPSGVGLGMSASRRVVGYAGITALTVAVILALFVSFPEPEEVLEICGELVLLFRVLELVREVRARRSLPSAPAPTSTEPGYVASTGSAGS